MMWPTLAGSLSVMVDCSVRMSLSRMVVAPSTWPLSLGRKEGAGASGFARITFGSSKKVVSCCMSALNTCRGQGTQPRVTKNCSVQKKARENLSAQTRGHARASDAEKRGLKRIEQGVAHKETAGV